MNTRSLKFRLVVWYAGWLTVLFIFFGFFVYASLGYYLKESLREALARRTRQVADLAQRGVTDWQQFGRDIRINFAPEANNRFTRVSKDGVILYVAGNPADKSFNPSIVPPAATMEDGESFGRRLLPGGKVLLVVVITRTTPEGKFVTEEGSDEAPLQNTLHAWLAALVAGLAVLILVAISGGFLLVHRALDPLDKIIATANQISSRNLSERLPVPQTGDEFERLSVTLNHMIQRLEEAFQHTQRFLADASHELRTPLTVIQAEVETILEKAKGVSGSFERAASVLEEVERLGGIVEGLFALSRLDAGEALEHRTQFDLAELVTSTADQMSLLADDRQITITCNCSQEVRLEGDRSRLKQVVVNLLDNAIKYTQPGGHIDVGVSKQQSRALLEVSDNGIGIPKEAHRHIFERFFRVDKARSRDMGGAGLGLSIVKSICTAHGGVVGFESKEGAGTRFVVELPISARNGN